MQQLSSVLFASSNKNKFEESRSILEEFGVELGFFKTRLEEIQSESLCDIAKRKAIDAFKKCKKAVIIEDDGLFIDSLNGFPGPYSSFVFSTIGNKGILDLVKQKRKARFQSIIVYCDKNQSKVFSAELMGKISTRIRGKGWGYDPVFVPNGFDKTFAQLSNKDQISHRYLALKKFSSWYKKRSTCR